MSTIAIDLDGTAYEYHTAYCYMAREYLYADIKAEDWKDWDYPDAVLSPMQASWMTEMAPSQGLYRYGHIMKGAIVGIRKLAERHELVVVTHRPREAVSDTLAWLVYADLPVSGVHILSDRQAKSSVAWDILIDDREFNIEDAVNHARVGILYDQPWNQHYTARYRATWADMEEKVADALRV